MTPALQIHLGQFLSEALAFAISIFAGKQAFIVSSWFPGNSVLFRGPIRCWEQGIMDQLLFSEISETSPLLYNPATAELYGNYIITS